MPSKRTQVNSTGLTDRQSQVLSILKKHERKIVDLTIRQLGAELGIKSPNGVLVHIAALKRKGFIKTSQKRARGIELV